MKRIYDDTQLQECYEAGYSAGLNGSNTINTHFSLFSSPNRTKAWERGHKRGKTVCTQSQNSKKEVNK